MRELSGRLANEGWIDPWVDEKKLLPGQDWRTKIEEAVETSDVVIICLSSNSVTKEGFVQKELRYAREIAFEKPDETIFLIPLRLDDCTVPRGLRFYQWGDYFGDEKEKTYKALLESLKLRHEQKLRLEEEEHAQREKTEKERIALEEQARKEAEEKARLEAEERAQRESEEREHKAAEKAARDKAEKEAIEKARLEAEKNAKEKASREKAKREKVERQITQISKLNEQFSESLTNLKSSIPRLVAFIRIVSLVGIVFILLWVGSRLISQNSEPKATLTTNPTLEIIVYQTFQALTSTAVERTTEPTVTPTELPVRTATTTGVSIPTTLFNVGFDLYSQAPNAIWISGAGNLTFGGPDTDGKGFAMYKDNQKLEDGTIASKVVEVHPQFVDNGVVTGRYPAYTIVAGERFTAKIGFLASSDGTCGTGNVKFQLNYREGSGPVVPLVERTEICDGKLTSIDVDLTALESKSIEIILAVLANGPSTDDSAVWVSPLISIP